MISAIACFLAMAPVLQSPAAPPPPPAPATPETASSPCDCALDPSVFAREIDGMRDVRPVRRDLARLQSPIASVELDLGSGADSLEVRRGDRTVELLGRDSKGGSAVIGALEWEGAVLSWRWHRVSAGLFADALRDADSLLRTAWITARLSDGSSCAFRSPPAELSVTVKLAATQRVRIPASPGTRLEPALVEGDEWQLGDPSQVGARWLASPEAGLWLTYDARTAHLKVEWPDPVAQQVQAMRAKVAELRKEAARRSDTDRRFIEAEIAANEREIKSAEATARPGPFEKPAVIELRDPKGRAYARVTIQSR